MNVCVYYSCSQTLTSDDVPVTSEESVESPAERSEPPAKRVHLDPPESPLRLDIASYIVLPSAEQTDDKKHQLIVHHFVPDATYKFPKAASGRSFQYKWLSRFPWLRYSEKADGGYCLACVLFSHSSSFRSDPGVLVKTPLTDFKRALEKLDHHSDRGYHKTAIIKIDEFSKVMSGRQINIQSQLDSSRISENRQKLKSMKQSFCVDDKISLFEATGTARWTWNVMR